MNTKERLKTPKGLAGRRRKKKNFTIYDWDKAPNIDLTDKRVLWWDEEVICIEKERLGGEEE